MIRFSGKVAFEFTGSVGCQIRSGLKKITRRPQYEIFYSGNGKTSIEALQTLEWSANGMEARISFENYRRTYELGSEQHSEFVLKTKTPLVLKLKKPFHLSRSSRLLPGGIVSITAGQKKAEETLYQIQQLEWNKPACCFPTSGKISAKNSGNVLQFSSSCGGVLLSNEETHKKSVGSLSSCSG